MAIKKRKGVYANTGKDKYGDVDFADETNKKYPIDTEEHIRAAWNYIHKAKNAAKYSASDVKKIKARIVAAWKEKIDKDGPPEVSEKAEMTVELINLDKPGSEDFTEADLQELADTYDPEGLHEAPLTIGHVSDYPDTRLPAWGWADKVQAVGRKLVVHIKQFSEALKDMMDEGSYRKFSAGVWPPDAKSNPTPGKWHLHHVAILGAVPPAIKGMAPAEYSEASDEIELLECAESHAKVEGPSMDGVRDRIKEHTKKNMSEIAGRHLSHLEDQVDNDEEPERMRNTLYDMANDMHGELGRHHAAIEKMDDMDADDGEYSEEHSVLREFADRLSELIFGKQTQSKESDMDQMERRRYEDMIATLEKRVREFSEKQKAIEQKAQDEKLRADIREYCEKKKLNSNKMKELKLEDALFNIAKTQGVVEFSEAKKSTLEAIQGVLDAIGVGGPSEGELSAFKGKDPSASHGATLISAAREYADKHLGDIFKGIEVQEAVSRAIKMHATGKIDLLANDNK